MPQKNTSLTRRDRRVRFRLRAHASELSVGHDEKEFLLRLRQNNKILRFPTTPARRNRETILLVDGMTELARVEGLGLRVVVHTPAEDFAIRRRLVTVLAASRSADAFEGLFDAMGDRRFEVRYRAARALSYLAGEIPGLRIDRDRVFEVVFREMAVERGIWETRQLIDLPDDDTSPMEAEVLRGRTSRSLEHLFTLLSLVLPPVTVRLAFHSLHTGDRHLRGTALEYLETVLPETVWQKLWPFLSEEEAQPARPGLSSGQAMQELLASQESIVLALAEIRRREERT